MFLIFNFWSWIFDKSSKLWAASCKKESNLLLVRFTVCIEPCFPIGWRTEKICQSAALFWFGLRNDEFFTCKPQSKEHLMSLPHLWSSVWRKRSRLEHMQTVNRTSRRIGGEGEIFSCSEMQSIDKILHMFSSNRFNHFGFYSDKNRFPIR